MYDIKLKVNADGTIDTGKTGRLHLGTELENRRARFVVDVDNTVEGAYRYIKLYHPKSTLLLRLTNGVAVLPQNLFVHAGVWLLSFLASDEAQTPTQITGTYVFITEPIEAVVVEGLPNSTAEPEEVGILQSLVAIDFNKLYIPHSCTRIGNYFLYKCDQLAVDIEIGNCVESIGCYAFYDLLVAEFIFEEGSSLKTLDQYALSHVRCWVDGITFPKSLETWSKYVLNGGNIQFIHFEKNSNIRKLGANAFNGITVKEIILPDKLEVFSASDVNSYVIRKCEGLKKLWIPNTLTQVIPATAIYETPSIQEIVLQDGFNVSANFSNCPNLTIDSIVAMLYALKNRSNTTANTLTLGSENLAKLNSTQKAIATNKNWTLS